MSPQTDLRMVANTGCNLKNDTPAVVVEELYCNVGAFRLLIVHESRSEYRKRTKRSVLAGIKCHVPGLRLSIGPLASTSRN